MRYVYEAEITPDGEYLDVYFPDLVSRTFGKDLADAANMGADLLETVLSSLIEEGERIPAATYGRSVPNGGRLVCVSVDVPAPEPDTMTTQDAADTLGVTPARIRAMVRDGVLDGIKWGHDTRVVTASVKERFNNPRSAGRPQKELTTA